MYRRPDTSITSMAGQLLACANAWTSSERIQRILVTRLLHGEIASIDGQDSSGHPGRFIARQIDRQSCNILGSAEPADGMCRGSFPTNCCWIGSLGDDSRGQIGLYERRTNCVDPDIFMPVIDGHTFRQQDHCTLRWSIGCAVRSADNSERGSHVYD